MDYIIIISFIIAVTVLIIFRQYNRAKERLALIEKGLDPSLVNIYPKNNRYILFLYSGVILLGFAMGIITGILLAALFQVHGETKELIFLSVLIFTGITCILCYYISRRVTS